MRELIIARCYADEPALLEVRAVVPRSTNLVYYVVSRPSSLYTVGWNPGYAYEYSASLLAELQCAYADGEVGRLASLWATARRASIGHAEKVMRAIAREPISGSAPGDK